MDNLDNFNLSEEEFNFNPLTEGLGFNQEKYKKFVEKTTVTSRDIESIKRKAKFENKKAKKPVTFKMPNASVDKKTPIINKKSSSFVSSKETISFFKKLCSWLIDLVVITGSVLIVSTLINYFLLGTMNLNLIENTSFWTYFMAPFFITYYIFYFSIFWKTTNQTLGMHLLDLSIESKRKEDLSFAQTFLRAIFSFCSIFTAGIFEVLGFSSAISWTEIKSK